MSAASVERIVVYPIKSLDGVSVQQAEITEAGALVHDRKYAIVDSAGNFVNAKRFSNIHEIRASYSADLSRVTLSAKSKEESFALNDQKGIAAWLSNFFSIEVSLRKDARSGFPDDTIASGPTFVSLATLETVRKWFQKIEPFDIEEAVRRFRPNIVIQGADSFYEDQLCGGKFFVGDATIIGTNPCARCAVPSRDSRTGQVTTGFAKILTEQRKKSLPATSNPGLFDHYYRLCLNTRIPSSEEGKLIRRGDRVQGEWDSFGDIF
ncbi:MAG: MOSC N-terminal beta barrel domain-containing protein [Leptospirales bacterium]|nr:MOSC N-terminal beta barrel domain-containing protein [Leptospirales bacterium]